jgi:hypothetical protein
MTNDPVEKNLLLFLDPAEEVNQTLWRFVSRPKLGAAVSELTIYCFDRSDLAGFLLFSWFAKRKRVRGAVRVVFFLNDGLLSSILDAENTRAYRTFAARHLPLPSKLRQRLVALLPLALRAEKKYVVVIPDRATGESSSHARALLKMQDFMFFSNASGKLLLTSAETLLSGKGDILKTTAHSGYLEVMEKEFSTTLAIESLRGESVSLPRSGRRLLSGNRVFFTEAYVQGKSLRDLLHSLSLKNDLVKICDFLDLLDGWFEEYRSIFKSKTLPLALCYQHLFAAFTSVYAKHDQTGIILEKMKQIVSELGRKQICIAPITAHNDLWPGNFVVGADGLVAIDWERAVENRAPIFDYYWMIISAALEHIVCNIGTVDYSRAFRIFLQGHDLVSCRASEMLGAFLDRLGLDKIMHQNFLFLFLMEWSVQGFLALGRQTAMDKLAFEELVAFACTGPGGAVT